jgi:hypothetical protein
VANTKRPIGRPIIAIMSIKISKLSKNAMNPLIKIAMTRKGADKGRGNAA